MLKILVIDGPIMFGNIFRILAGILSIPVDFDVLRFRITEITSAVHISVNVNVDLSGGA